MTVNLLFQEFIGKILVWVLLLLKKLYLERLKVDFARISSPGSFIVIINIFYYMYYFAAKFSLSNLVILSWPFSVQSKPLLFNVYFVSYL